MKAITLLYHDVVLPGQSTASGFNNPGSARYKLDVEEFSRHLRAIAQETRRVPSSIFTLLNSASASPHLLLTFDDGGSSAYTTIADLLESYGWRGHFFVTANYIGTETFVTSEQIRELHKRGHVIGSHSCSHPDPMSQLTLEELVREWQVSTNILSEILGEQVNIASLPGGYYSPNVAKAAAMAGIKVLFTSYPTTRIHMVNGCAVFGRYTVWRGMAPTTAAQYAAGQFAACAQQWLTWNAKGILKTLGGNWYLKQRERMSAAQK